VTTKEDLIFRQVITLRDGARILLRPLVPEDKKALMDLFLPTPVEETRFMRHNINDPDVISDWAVNVNYDNVFPIVAIVGDRIVGNATLHFNYGPSRHRAELRIFLAKDFRRRGLGGRLVQALVEIAKKRSLYLLEVQIISNQVEVIKSFQKSGFIPKCIFEDYFMLPDGELRDITYMTLRLRMSDEDF
jgi:RimJ/RimL family protein N-acetyltransferase